MPKPIDILSRLGMTIPIVQAPMAGVSTPAMAAAVSTAGGLGSLGLGASTAQAAHAALTEAQTMTDRPINANVFCHKPATSNPEKEATWLTRLAPEFAQYDAEPPSQIFEIYNSFLTDKAMFEMLLAAKPGVVSFHFGLPNADWISALQAKGNILLATATNLTEAGLIEAAGIDAIVAQGWEAGGHRGCFDLNAPDDKMGTVDLTRAVANAAAIPVISAGGIMDGAMVRAALAAGAQAAQMGTAFISCTESVADAGYRKVLASAKPNGTTMTRVISGRPARCLNNKFTELGVDIPDVDVPDYPKTYDAGKALNAAAKTQGDIGFGAHWSGSNGAASRPMGTTEMMEVLKAELAET